MLCNLLGTRIICHSSDILLGQNHTGAENLAPEWVIFALLYC